MNEETIDDLQRYCTSMAESYYASGGKYWIHLFMYNGLARKLRERGVEPITKVSPDDIAFMELRRAKQARIA